jgi:hypothetical protein
MVQSRGFLGKEDEIKIILVEMKLLLSVKRFTR